MIGQTNCKKRGQRYTPYSTKLSLLCIDKSFSSMRVSVTILLQVRSDIYYGIHARGITDPQEQIPMALSPRLIFCPSDTRNCPSFTASPTFCNVYFHCRQKNVCLCGPKIFGLLAPSVIGYKDWGDMLWVCLRLSVQRLTSFMTPVFVPPDRTQAFVALAAPIRPAFNDQIRSP